MPTMIDPTEREKAAALAGGARAGVLLDEYGVSEFFEKLTDAQWMNICVAFTGGYIEKMIELSAGDHPPHLG